MGDRLPPMLTVEEAARLIRVGRTKAYAMTREWRATNGRSGLPVVDFGDVLRVPTAQLEALIGAPLESRPQQPTPSKDTAPPPSKAKAATADREARRQPRRRARPNDAPQLALFAGDEPPATRPAS